MKTKDKSIRISAEIYRRVIKLKKETGLPIRHIIKEAVILITSDSLRKI